MMYTSTLSPNDFTPFSWEVENGDLNRGSASFHKGDRKGKKPQKIQTEEIKCVCTGLKFIIQLLVKAQWKT